MADDATEPMATPEPTVAPGSPDADAEADAQGDASQSEGTAGDTDRQDELDLADQLEERAVAVSDPVALATDADRIAIGIDVGGSGIKAAAVDVKLGRLVSDRIRVPTPEPSTPASVIDAIAKIVRRIERGLGRTDLPIGVDFPAVVIDGRTMSAANVDPGWVQYPAVEHLERTLRRKVALINDADAAGIAEMRFGAGAGHAGVVLILTLGTGVGSALFVDGILVPNTELGHMEIRGRDAERRSAAAARIRRGLSWKAWTNDLDEHLQAIDKILWPDLIIIGGGVSKNADKFIPRLEVRPPVVPALLRNEAGIVGAAMWAAEHERSRSIRPEDAARAEEEAQTEATAMPTPGQAPEATEGGPEARGSAADEPEVATDETNLPPAEGTEVAAQEADSSTPG